jgi:prepilin-type N-terminal cleavage/methylation domain-containing protein/prepilin-type processing-associated H-X9-DG protein
MASFTGAGARRRNRISDGKRSRRGFTLVELLVVIAIISLLVTMIAPTLTKARRLGQRTVCLANLRRLASAVLLYCADNEDTLPPFRLRRAGGAAYEHNFGGRWYRKNPRWQWFLTQGAGAPILPQNYDSQEAFNAALEMDNDYFICPSLTGEYSHDIRNGAYGYNYQYLGNSRGITGGWINFPVELDDILPVAGTVLIADSRGGDIPHGKHAYTLDPPKLGVSVGATTFGPHGPGYEIEHSPAEPRHEGAANVSFCDGHARTMELEDVGYHVDEEGNPIANGPHADNSKWTGTGSDEP